MQYMIDPKKIEGMVYRCLGGRWIITVYLAGGGQPALYFDTEEDGRKAMESLMQNKETDF